MNSSRSKEKVMCSIVVVDYSYGGLNTMPK